MISFLFYFEILPSCVSSCLLAPSVSFSLPMFFRSFIYLAVSLHSPPVPHPSLGLSVLCSPSCFCQCFMSVFMSLHLGPSSSVFVFLGTCCSCCSAFVSCSAVITASSCVYLFATLTHWFALCFSFALCVALSCYFSLLSLVTHCLVSLVSCFCSSAWLIELAFCSPISCLLCVSVFGSSLPFVKMQHCLF